MANQKPDELDRILDTALARYASVEPREGLEQRVLANLRAEPPIPERAWWRWGVVAAVAAAIVITVALASRSSRPSHPAMANHPSATTNAPNEGPQIVSNREENGVRVHPQARGPAGKTTRPRAPMPVMLAAQPKLDQFPSLQPLSEQEQVLARYVSQFPQEAALIARAQEDYEKEMKQKMAYPSSETEKYVSDQTER
jgi:hypothetical protein